MATTPIPPLAPEAEVELSGGRLVTIRHSTPEDTARVVVFLASPGTRHLCSEPGAAGDCTRCRGGASDVALPNLVAMLPEGDVLATGWLLPPAGEGPARLAMAVHAGYQHGEVPTAVFRSLGAEAARHGYDRFTTCVTSLRGEPFEEFRAAGLRVESSFSLGGVTEVELSVE
ncbi:MAG: hypothetical protein IT302_02940 [Dehalococcoidia bacterium]|nr:hypothetical protein [Dehalococcoidia bacterium]